MIPVLPTTVVGSYSVPEWLERLKARALAEAGAELLQIDEPFLAGYPEIRTVGCATSPRISQGRSWQRW